MDGKKVAELALETLHARQALIGAEISQLRSEIAQLLGEARTEAAPLLWPRMRRSRTIEQRKRHSVRMRQIWAARKARKRRI